MGKANKDDAVVALLKDQLDEFKQVQSILLPVDEPVVMASKHLAQHT